MSRSQVNVKVIFGWFGVARWLSGRASDLRSKESRVRGPAATPAATLLRNNLRQVVHTLLPVTKQYNLVPAKAGK